MKQLHQETTRIIKVLIVEDEPLLRLGIQMALKSFASQVVVIGEVTNAADAVTFVQEHRPDIVLLDLRLPARRSLCTPSLDQGISVIEEITKRPQPPRILVLSYLKETNAVFQALRAGASGYIAKDDHFRGEDLVDAIVRVAAGEAIYGPTVAHQISSFFANPNSGEDSPKEQLTARETEVLALLSQEKTNEEIAAELIISESTVKTHVSSILAKLHLKSRHQARWYTSIYRQQ